MDKRNGLVVLLLCMVLPWPAQAGQLSDFEAAVSKPSKSSSSYTDYYDDDKSGFFSALSSDCAGNVFAGLIIGTYNGVKWLVYDWWAKPEEQYADVVFEDPSDPASSNYIPPPAPNADQSSMADERQFGSERYAGESDAYSETEPDFIDEAVGHEAGAFSLPYLRADYRWQYLNHDMDANDWVLEAGYKMVAFYGRYTSYEDRAAEEHLDIGQYYGLLRMGESDDFLIAGCFQAGIGAGGYVIDGVDRHAGPALTLPVQIYPADWWGVEIRPAWARINEKTISDYDVSLSAGYRFLQLRAGYRWFWVQQEGHWLDGPYAGISISF